MRMRLLKKISTYFPKRDELLLRFVLALPNASRMGFASRIFSSTPPSDSATSARYFKQNFVHTVLPAPDSPLITTDCAVFSVIPSRRFLYASDAVMKTCGGMIRFPRFAYFSMIAGVYKGRRLNGLTAMRIVPTFV